jgi:hypothetical protein
MVALGTIHDLSQAPGPVVSRHAHGLDMARLCIGAGDTVVVCDIPATDHSWFEYKDAENIVRWTIRDSADIGFVPTGNAK